MTLRSVFVSPAEPRLRAGWRILLFLVAFAALNVVVQTAFKALNGGIPDTTETLRTAMLIAMVALVASVVVPLARRVLDRRTVVSLGVRLDRPAVADALFGIALSGAMATVFFGIVWAAGLVEVAGLQWGVAGDTDGLGPVAARLATMGAGTLAFHLGLTAVVSWWEELVFRGYLLQNLIDGLGLALAVVVSCVLYGVVHAGNPNATLLSSAIIVAFGVLRIYGVLSTGQLWLSFGMHLGWNLFQGTVFGFAASGQSAASVVALVPTGPEWLSGGAFGPEGSVLILPVVGGALLAMRWWAGRAERPIPARSGTSGPLGAPRVAG